MRFASQGADVVLADLDPAVGESAAADIAQSSGQQALFVQCDVTDENSQSEAFAQGMEAFGRIDGVLAAAGVSSATYVSGKVNAPVADPEAGFLINKPLGDWQRVLDVNLSGVMLSCRTAANLMIEAGIKGTPVNIASVAGRIGLAGAGDYCVSKAGVVMLTQVLARELVGYGIRVNAIGPGFDRRAGRVADDVATTHFDPVTRRRGDVACLDNASASIFACSSNSHWLGGVC